MQAVLPGTLPLFLTSPLLPQVEKNSDSGCPKLIFVIDFDISNWLPKETPDTQTRICLNCAPTHPRFLCDTWSTGMATVQWETLHRLCTRIVQQCAFAQNCMHMLRTSQKNCSACCLQHLKSLPLTHKHKRLKRCRLQFIVPCWTLPVSS